MDHARFSIDLPNGRSLVVGTEQVRRIARGLGASGEGESEAPILKALGLLPADERADALAVALLRFGQKQDVESISQSRRISIWRVWQLEEEFRQALAQVQRGAAV